jgi:hypothetical protein
MALTRDKIRGLVEQLLRIGHAGQADTEDPEQLKQGFYVVPEHARAFDPSVVLVVGDRGAGKTALFRIVLELKLLEALKRAAPRVQLPESHRVEMIRCFGSAVERDAPSAPGLRSLLGGEPSSRADAVDLWAAYLVRALKDQLSEEERVRFEQLLERRGGETSEIMNAYRPVAEAAVVAMDHLDERLEMEDRWIFVGYDELDTLGGRDWKTMQAGAQGLVSFWAEHNRRWRRIRPKLFLRSDLFRRAAAAQGADVAKLAGNRVELTWSDQGLYAVLLKRLVAAGSELEQYVDQAPGPKVAWRDDPDLGWVPELTRALDARPLVDRLVGSYMGANTKKGLTFNWLLDHVRDGLGVATPRALVSLVEKAADREHRNRRARGNRLLHPSSLRRALDDVSLDHVSYARHEWPWLPGLHRRLDGVEVPRPRREIEQCLASGWELSWSDDESFHRPPASNARELVDYLLEVGILRERKVRGENRLDAPDLYLAGLGLKRRGGVRRR